MDRPGQQLLPIDAALIDVELDLLPGPFDQLVALSSGEPPGLSRISKASGVRLALEDHLLEMLDPLGGL